MAALASWLDARAAPGRWLVRMEDVDTPRVVPGAGHEILRQLAALGLVPDEEPVWQSTRGDAYQAALDALIAQGMAFPCACSRKNIEDALAAQGRPHQRRRELVYPGTCRAGLGGRAPRAWRFKVPPGQVQWTDRRLGPQSQDVEHEVGDFILKRADGVWAYQLAVVVDDAHQGVTHVVRGEDLADNTARQILLQRALGLATPDYLHAPLVMGADGEKLSKQNGATPLDTTEPLRTLNAAAAVLSLPRMAVSVSDALLAWQAHWRRSYNPTGD